MHKQYTCPECKGKKFVVREVDGELDTCFFCEGTGFATDEDVEEKPYGWW